MIPTDSRALGRAPDQRNVRAMVSRAEAMIGLGRDDDARLLIGHAMAINSTDPELLRMFSQLSKRQASTNIEASIQKSTPDIVEG